MEIFRNMNVRHTRILHGSACPPTRRGNERKSSHAQHCHSSRFNSAVRCPGPRTPDPGDTNIALGQ